MNTIYHPELNNHLNFKIGEGCKIHSHTWIGNNVVIGNNVKIEAFSFIPEGVVVEDDVFIASTNSLQKINEKYPESHLLTATNNLFKDYEANEWLWPFCLQIFSKPCYCSMMCACRVSKELLKLICDCSNKYKFAP